MQTKMQRIAFSRRVREYSVVGIVVSVEYGHWSAPSVLLYTKAKKWLVGEAKNVGQILSRAFLG